jgi:hypothetical protein
MLTSMRADATLAREPRAFRLKQKAATYTKRRKTIQRIPIQQFNAMLGFITSGLKSTDWATRTLYRYFLADVCPRLLHIRNFAIC